MKTVPLAVAVGGNDGGHHEPTAARRRCGLVLTELAGRRLD